MFCQNPNYIVQQILLLGSGKGYKFSFLRPRRERINHNLYKFQAAMRMSLALVSSIKWKKRSSKKMRKRQKGESFEIPLDLQIEILARLPAKSLMRFKCVSKLWSFLIRSRYLSNLYLTVPRPPRLFMSLVDRHCSSMEVLRNPEKSLLVSLPSSSDLMMTLQGIGGHNMVSLRGLILYILGEKAWIFNPSTTQIITLPAVEPKLVFTSEQGTRMYMFYFLGHDPVLDQYKVVYNRVVCSKDLEWIESEYWVYLLEAGGSWKRIEFDQPHVATSLGVCINGAIYYLGSDLPPRDIVVSFDVRHEKFDRIQVPQEVNDYCDEFGFIEYAGKPAIFDHTHLRASGLVELWVLESGGMWSKKSLALRPCQMHLVGEDLTVAGTTQNDEVIFVPERGLSAGYILYYDLQRNDLRQVNIGGEWDQELRNQNYTYLTLMDKGESIIHLETLMI